MNLRSPIPVAHNSETTRLNHRGTHLRDNKLASGQGLKGEMAEKILGYIWSLRFCSAEPIRQLCMREQTLNCCAGEGEPMTKYTIASHETLLRSVVNAIVKELIIHM